jgi:hypothetical protein
MWAWNGQSWITVSLAGSALAPEGRSGGLTTYDPDHKAALLLFGGGPGFPRQLWSWKAGRWTQLSDPPMTANGFGSGMAYDVARHQLVVVTTPATFRMGTDPQGVLMETWLSKDGVWHQAKPVHNLPFPPNSVVFDASSGRVLASRLISSATEVWSWDGLDWSLAAQQIPTPRAVLVDGGDVGTLAVDAGDPLSSPPQPRPVFRLLNGRWLAAGPPTVGPTSVSAPAYDQHRKELVVFGDLFRSDQSWMVYTYDTWTWTLAGGWTRHAGPTPTPTPSPTPSPSPTPCPSPIPPSPFAASTPSARTVALVTLTGSNQIVVRDITDIDHPTTIATTGIPDYLSPTLVSGTELAALNAQGIVRMPFAGSPQVQATVVCPGVGIARYRWSRDGRFLTYVAEVEDATAPRGNRFDWHLVANGSDRVIGTAPAWCHCDGEHGRDIFDFQVAFSPDGRYVSLVENVVAATDFQVRRLDGTLVSEIKPTGTDQVTMGVWSGDTLYFRDSKGVEAWKDGTITPFLPGVAWITPKASPAGGEIVYVARGSDGVGRLYIVATATKSVVQLGPALRFDPVFLSSRYVWYEGERLCTPADYCQVEQTRTTGITYIYDRQLGTETQSRITAVYDVWPPGS